MPTFAIRDEAMREPHAGMEAGHTRPDTEAAHATNRTLNSMVCGAWKAKTKISCPSFGKFRAPFTPEKCSQQFSVAKDKIKIRDESPVAGFF